jgi:hypothetical protein
MTGEAIWLVEPWAFGEKTNPRKQGEGPSDIRTVSQLQDTEILLDGEILVQHVLWVWVMSPL